MRGVPLPPPCGEPDGHVPLHLAVEAPSRFQTHVGDSALVVVCAFVVAPSLYPPFRYRALGVATKALEALKAIKHCGCSPVQSAAITER